MKHKLVSLGVALLATAIVSSCGDKEAGAAPPAASQPTEAEPEAPVHGALTPNPEMKESEHFTGHVNLREALATGPGFVFVTVGRIGSPMPYLMKKYDAEGASVTPGPDGSRVLEFELTSADNFMDMPLPETDIELKVRFDLDGFVETKVDSVLETLAVEPGAQDLEVTMVEAPAYNPAEDG
jgi:hypothetical protein